MPITSLIFDDTASFDTWLGSRRVFGDTMRLAFSDSSAYAGLTIPNGTKLFHMRWGNTRSFGASSPVAGYSDTIELVANGVVRTGASEINRTNAYLEPPGVAGDYQVIYEPSSATLGPLPPDQASVVASFVVSAWTRIDVDQFSVLMGDHFHPDFSVDDPDLSRWTTMYVAATPGVTGTALSVHLQGRGAGGVNHTRLFSSIEVPADTSLRHLMVHIFYTKDYTPGEGRKLWCRWFLDGRYQGQTVGAVDAEFRWWLQPTGGAAGALQLHNGSTMVPGLLALKLSTPTWDVSNPYGQTEASWPWPFVVDEMIAARAWPILQSGYPVVNHTWASGDQVFPARRHPDPAVVGVAANDLITYTAVYDSEMGPGYGFARVQLDFSFPSPSSGQHLSVSVRASDTPFAVDSVYPLWGPWTTITSPMSGQTVELPKSVSNSGNYVQMRLRMFPSGDTLCTVSPEITRIEAWVDYVAYLPMSEDLEFEVTVKPYWDLEFEILALGTLVEDLEFEVGVYYTMPPTELEFELEVPLSVPLEFELEVVPPAVIASDLEFEMVVMPPAPGIAVDLEFEMEVVRYTMQQDLEFSLTVRLSAPLEFEIEVTVITLEFEMLVQQSVTADLEFELTVPQEIPGGVTPVLADVPSAVWQTQEWVTFSWSTASWVDSPVVDYYWNLTTVKSNPGPLDSIVEATTVATTVPAGRWFFNVAARNTMGVFGPTGHFEVWVNHIPAAPGVGLMTVNGLDCLSTIPLVGSSQPPVLAWSPSQDDDTDSMTYDLQIASNPDFADQHLIKTAVEIPAATYIWSNNTQTGLFYWRVRGSDGRQTSGWSPIGVFRLNSPPPPPINLRVIKVR